MGGGGSGTEKLLKWKKTHSEFYALFLVLFPSSVNYILCKICVMPL